MRIWIKRSTIAATMALSATGLVRAQEDMQDRVIQIAPGNVMIQGVPGAPGGAPPGAQLFLRGSLATGPTSEFMIGISASPVSDELRAQVELPKGAGLVVSELIADGPAAKAGIEKYDILVTADGKKLKSMEQLIDAVDKHGKDESTITVELLRKGESVSIDITPAKRPEESAEGHAMARGGMPRQDQFIFRNFGPMVMGMPGQPGGVAMPDGVSISIEKSNDKPTKITVKRGDDEWTVEGDDPEALAELPDDLRPAVEAMLHGGPGGLGGVHVLGAPGPGMAMPGGPAENQFFRWAVPGVAGVEVTGRAEATNESADEGVAQRLEAMEKQIEALRKALEEQE